MEESRHNGPAALLAAVVSIHRQGIDSAAVAWLLRISVIDWAYKQKSFETGLQA